MPPGGGGEHDHGYGEPAEAMPPGAGGGDRGCGEPAAAHGVERRDEDDPSRSSRPPLLPGVAVILVESEEEEQKKREHEQAEVSFPEDILMEILSRVPYRSLCRFKCVSRTWLALCSDHGVRKRSPQALSGFFYRIGGWRFHNLSGKGPPMVDPDLPFLRGTYKQFTVQQCSTSLLLCKCWKSSHPMQRGWNSFPGQFFRWPEVDQFDYVVCNPATQEWTSLPPIEWGNQADGCLSHFSHGDYILGFDPQVPSRFVVFATWISDHSPLMVMFYSSDTRGWTSVQGHQDALKTYWFSHSKCTFLNGSMHLSNYLSIVTVDMEGNYWREIKMPPAMKNKYGYPSIGQSQGRLYAWRICSQNDCQLSIWVLENYDSEQWTLRCTINFLELFGRDCRKEYEFYWMFAIHPECESIFITDGKEKVLSYDMNNEQVHVICASGDLLEGLPYTPCFAEWKTNGHY